MSKPAIVFVPGAWHTPAEYNLLLTPLEAAGFKVKGVRTPSVGASPSHTSMSQDVAAVRAALVEAVEAGEDVVMMGHSYGGIPGGEACEGLGKREREKEGKKGGVVRVVYLAAFALDVGVSLMMATGGPPEWLVFKDNDPNTVTCADPPRIFYNDVPPAAAAAASSRLLTHSFPTMESPQTYAAWRHIPATYIICEFDAAIPPVAQEAMSSQEGAFGGKWEVKRLRAGHSPQLSMPEEAARVVEGVCVG